MLVLATVTSIPNVLAATRLARKGRGAAVVSEGLNSNTFNVLGGILLPMLVLGRSPVAHLTRWAAWWLLGMTVLTLGLLAWRRGLHHWGGTLLLALYAVFVGLIVLWF